MFYESLMWTIIFIVTGLVLIVGLLYLISRINGFKFLDKIASQNKPFRKILPVLILAAGILIVNLIFGYMNVVVILITYALFVILVELLLFFLKKTKHPKLIIERHHAIWIALIVASLFLAYGWFVAHHVVETDYNIATNKSIEPTRIVLISDAHLGTTFDGEGFAKNMKKVQACNPDIVLVTGDYVDGSSTYEDLATATKALGEIKTTYGVYYCFGNHDKNFYNHNEAYTRDMLLEEFAKNGIKVLEDDVVSFPNGITLIGRKDADDERLSISDLLKKANADSYTIVMDHQPNDYAAEEQAGADLVVSGHTHGGQLIPINQIGRIIGATDMIYGKEHRGNTDFIVTSGISNWGIDFKTGCVAEYVVIDIE